MHLKTFAQEGRRRLMAGVSRRLDYWGFDGQGQVTEAPIAVSGGFTHRGQIHDDPRALELWSALKEAMHKRGREVVIEEAAYTWFNRIMAMRILSRGGYDEPQLDVEAGASSLEPLMLRRARQGHAPFLSDEDRTRLNKVVSDYSKEQEAMALLLTGYCRQHGTLSEVFGRPDDFTELLLPDDMLKSGGFLDLLQEAERDADALTEEQYGKVELIGWLYQYYISEKKDEVFDTFKKGKKAEAKDIPAATQIFTPNWIVKYMVENTAGKAWLDKHPNSPLKEQMAYLVENEADGTRQPIIDRVEDLTLIDPACGSGHILVEGFDLIYQMYQEEFASPTEAVKSILEHNLFGLDIDDRAAQLSTFAVLLKAAQYDRDIWDRGYRPHVYAMPYKRTFDGTEVKTYLGEAGKAYANELEIALSRMWDAKNLGAVMKLKLSDQAHSFITARQKELESAQLDFFEKATIQDMTPFISVLLTMTRRYTAVVANPPYMGQKNMNADLKAYVNKNYPISKSDLFAVFMESTLAMAVKSGRMGMVNQHSWMFLSSYEKLRMQLLNDHGIESMLHLGPRAFEDVSGEVVQSTAFVMQREGSDEASTYHRLVDGPDGAIKHQWFHQGYRVYPNIPQSNFSKIPGSPIAYWVSDAVLHLFVDYPSFEEFGRPRVGMQTANNSFFLRSWSEINFTQFQDGSLKWVKYLKGGGKRRWFGNLNEILRFEKNGELLRQTKNATLCDLEILTEIKGTWSDVSSKGFAARKVPRDCFHDISGHCYFPDGDNEFFILAYLNSKVFGQLVDLLNPTLHYQVGNVKLVPFSPQVNLERVDLLSRSCVNISTKDWNLHETAWDFSGLSLLEDSRSLSLAYSCWLQRSSDDFYLLHENEEELNRIFIEVYGLQDELTPEVPLKDITILQEELDGNHLEALEDEFRAGGGQPIELPIKRDVVMQQFLSYCVGLMMGRYRLDEPGLHIAHPEPTAEEVASYSYNGHTVEIDDDAILPLMGSACQFPDDVLHRVYGLLDVMWGEETRTANVNFLEECLGKSLEKYLVKDFFKDHCKRYKKKPIYWLFSSKRGRSRCWCTCTG